MTLADTLFSAFGQITPSGMNPIFFWGGFFLIFGISYTTLKKVKPIGENEKVVIISSLVLALLVSLSPTISQVLAGSMPTLGVLMIFIVSMILAFSLMTGGEWKATGKWQTYPLYIIFIILAITFTSSIWGQWITIRSNSLVIMGSTVATADIELLIAIAIVLIFLYFILSQKSSGGAPTKK